MKLYLGPESSLEVIRYLRSTYADDELNGKTVRKASPNDCISTERAMDELDASAQLLLGNLSRPIHVFVDERAKTNRTERLVTHVFSMKIPYGAFIDIGHKVCICSPRFTCFLLASQLSEVQTILLGMELCGRYSYCQEDIPGHKDGALGCAFELPPVLKAKQFEMFASRLKGYRGAVVTRKVMRWVLDNSASPMETAVYLMLCLPKRLGGYGLPQPMLNPKLIISNPDGTKERYPDLFWENAGIDVEYNSDTEHSGEWARYRDSKREVELVVANVTVLPLTRLQVMDEAEFDVFAKGLRRLLGVRARGADASWVQKRSELRHLVLPNTSR